MAAVGSPCEDELLCPRCSDIYNFPVLLQCGHNVCRVCLQKFWEWKGCRECPVCSAVSIPEKPPINVALKIEADKYQQKRSNKNQEVCCLHNERLKIFCQNDEQPICLVCQMSVKHKVHKCLPVQEAAKEKKKEISSVLDSLRKKLVTLNKTKAQWQETKNYIQNQAIQGEQAIKEEFETLRLFLEEEEKARLKVLRQERDVKTQVMIVKLKSIEAQIDTLSSTIDGAEAALREKDLPFLQEYKQTKKRLKCNIQEPECIRDILINTAKHLGQLKFDVWNKMANIVRYVPVTLDPNTAQSNLKFFHELTSVQHSRQQPLPDNPERCTTRVCVLGATGFTSGKHSWTVEVGIGKEWYIGVAAESIKRKSVVFLKPSEGYWVISLFKDSYWAHASSQTKLQLKLPPARVMVKLDYEKGKIVFVNTVDSSIIHAYSGRFTERLFPYLSPGISQEEKTAVPLSICPLKITVDVE